MAELTPDKEISLADVARSIGNRWRMVALVTMAAAAVSAGIAFVLPVYFQAECVILPPQPEQSTQSLISGGLQNIGALGLLGGAGAQSLLRNPGDSYAGLLRSRTVADALIARFDLRRRYDDKTMVESRRSLARRSDIFISKDMLIHVAVEDREPAKAAELANAYVEELQRQSSRLALTSAGQRRLFFESQLDGERQALVSAESALKSVQQRSGLILPAGQGDALMRSIAQTRAEIASREVQAQAMRLYAAPQNPQLKAIEEEAAALRTQLEKLEKTGSGPGDPLVPAGRIPEASLEYLRMARDVKYHEALFGLLSQQAEAARLDEAKQAPIIQIVDRATAPDRKSWPPRALIVACAAVLAALAASAYAASQEGRMGRAYARL